MKKLILKVRNKSMVTSLKKFCDVTFVSKFTNAVTIEISDVRITKLDSDPNIISYRECDEGRFQPRSIVVN